MGSTDHQCIYEDMGEWGRWHIMWCVMMSYGPHRQFPKRFAKIVREDAARRFCQKWGIRFPGRVASLPC